jgi:hypothetical protein
MIQQDVQLITRTGPCIGWLAPNGKFYPCCYAEHSILAENIALSLYHTQPEDAREYMENKGWIVFSILYDQVYILWNVKYDPTQKQIDAMYNMYVITDDERWKKELHRALVNC